MAENKSKIDVHDILTWVMENKEDQATIDMVSHLIFPHTTKYKNLIKRYPQDDDVEVHV